MSSEKRRVLEKILKHYDISFVNQTSNATNITCPYCKDASYHCGIFHNDYGFSCWKCKSTGYLFDLLSMIVGLSYDQYISVINDFSRLEDIEDPVDFIEKLISGSEEDEDEERHRKRVVDWPPKGTVSITYFENSSNDPMSRLVRSFVERRDLSFDLCKKYQVRIGLIGRWTMRFIVPVFEEGRVVAYQGRDITKGKLKTKYLSCGDMSNYLFNIDLIKRDEQIAIVEGVFDCWHTPNSVATFGTNLSDTQIYKLSKLCPSEIVLAWDIGEDGSDAFWPSRRVIEKLAILFGEKVKSLSFPKGEDPGSLGYDEMKRLLATA